MSITQEEFEWNIAHAIAATLLKPKGYWPDEDRFVEFAGQQMTREDLTQLVLDKHNDLISREAAHEFARWNEWITELAHRATKGDQ